jgi:hypothetical protein
MKRLSIIFFIIFLNIANNYANPFVYAPKDKKKKEKKLPANIEAIEYSFALRPAYSIQSTWLSIRDKDKNFPAIIYRPNVLGSAGGKIKIKGITVSYMRRLPPNDENLRKYGETDYQNIDIAFQTRIVGFNFYYLNYNGYYLQTPENYYPIWNDSTDFFPHRDDLKVFSAGFKMHFVFTKSFSINAAFSQSERQKKSAGSFMLMLSNRYTQYRADEPLYPFNYVGGITKRDRNFLLGRGVFNTTYLAYGFGYSFIKGKFNFTPIILAGTGVQVQLFNNKENKELSILRDGRGLRMPFYFNYKNALGYNGDHFFFVITHSMELERIGFKDVKFNTFFFNADIGLGIRF